MCLFIWNLKWNLKFDKLQIYDIILLIKKGEILMISKYEFGQLIEKLEAAVALYKNTNYKYNENKLFLSNGKALEFKFKPQNIPHLLGIDIIALRNANFLRTTKPLDMLEELIERYDVLYRKMEDGSISYYSIFSPYIEDKIASFETVLKCDIQDVFFASEYSLPRAYLNGERNNYGCQYYIAIKDKQNNLTFLGLKKQEDERYYSPSSIIYADDVSKDNILRTLVENQRIMLINCVGRKNINVSNYLKNGDKYRILQELIELSNKYDGHLIVSGDFSHTLKKLLSSYNKEVDAENFISQLTLAVTNGNRVDVTSSFDESSRELAQSYNILIQKSNQVNPTSELKELKKLRQELLDLQQQVEMQQQVIDSKDKQLAEQHDVIMQQQQTITEQQTAINHLTSFKDDAFQLFKKYQ